MNAPEPAQPSTPLPSDSSVTGHHFVGAEPPVVPDYELIRRIGGGAYGDVWLARSTTGILRAVKIVWRHTFEDERPFQREFEGIQRFERLSREHPSQLALFHVGRNEGASYFYYVMELADAVDVPGAKCQLSGGDIRREETKRASPDTSHRAPDTYTPHTLRAELQHGRLPAARVLEIGLALSEALSHLHSHGLVHRDVKPSNVIFVNGRPKLADIGLVTDASDTCSIAGTEGYLPQEGPGMPQADIFALGKVLYEAATGLDRRSFPKLPEDLRSWPDVKQVFELNEILLKACAASVHERYKAAEEILADLERLSGGKSVRRAHQIEHGWRLIRRAAGWLTASTAVLAVIVLATRAWQPSASPRIEKRSTNEVANELFNLGKTHFHQFRGTNLQLAADCFMRATNADPNFGRAYGYLAATYAWEASGWNYHFKFLPQAREVAVQALNLDRSLAEPHLALACYHTFKEWAWSKAEEEFKHALKLSDSSFCHLCCAEFLRVAGRMDEALKEINEALARDEHSRIINYRLAAFLVDAGRFEEALKHSDKVLATDPSSAGMEQSALLALGRYDEAIEAERRGRIADGESKDKLEEELAPVKRKIHEEGPRAFWSRDLSWSKKQHETFFEACAHAQLAETNQAFESLTRCLQEREVYLTFGVMTDWRLNPLRSDPRFDKILEKMDLKPRKPRAQRALSK